MGIRTLIFISIYFPVINAFSHELHDELPRIGRYEYIKKDSLPGNLKIFEEYEKSKTRKVIYVCVHGAGRYSVRAQWDLEITTKRDAEKLAQQDCSEALAGFVLLAYMSKREFRY